MNRIEVHCHFLPRLDDGCVSVVESVECLRMMREAGYSRVFCTPHCCASMFSDPPAEEVERRVALVAAAAEKAKIGVQVRAGGEVRLNPQMVEQLSRQGIPTYGHAGKYVLVDLWEEDWPEWAVRGVEWLQGRGLTVILAHPERMPALISGKTTIEEIAKLGVLFQGNLGPIGGNDAGPIVALSRRFLYEGRYFMVGSDGHHASHLAMRLMGLKAIEEIVGAEQSRQLTEVNPGRLWG